MMESSVMNNKDNIQEKLNVLYRRSIRKFKPDEIPKSILMDLIRYATLAPSATNRQAWRFIIVTDPSLRQEMIDAGGAAFINKSPCGILVLYENTTKNVRYHDDIQSAAACIQNLLLAAHAYNLGACWVCNLPAKAFLRKLFNVPSNFSPIAYISLGYPDTESAKDVPRKHLLEDIVSENCFPEKAKAMTESRPLVYLERLLIWIFDRVPVPVKKKYLNKIIDKKFTKKFEN